MSYVSSQARSGLAAFGALVGCLVSSARPDMKASRGSYSCRGEHTHTHTHNTHTRMQHIGLAAHQRRIQRHTKPHARVMVLACVCVCVCVPHRPRRLQVAWQVPYSSPPPVHAQPVSYTYTHNTTHTLPTRLVITVQAVKHDEETEDTANTGNYLHRGCSKSHTSCSSVLQSS